MTQPLSASTTDIYWFIYWYLISRVFNFAFFATAKNCQNKDLEIEYSYRKFKSQKKFLTYNSNKLHDIYRKYNLLTAFTGKLRFVSSVSEIGLICEVFTLCFSSLPWDLEIFRLF